jgi:hypothetical protein
MGFATPFARLASRSNSKKRSEGTVHGAGVRKCLRHVRVEDDDVGTLSDPRGILAPDAASEVIFLAHLIDSIVTGSLLHSPSAPAVPQAER